MRLTSFSVTGADTAPISARPLCDECGQQTDHVHVIHVGTLRVRLCDLCFPRLIDLIGRRPRRRRLSRRELVALATLANAGGNPPRPESLANINTAVGGYATNTVKSLEARRLVAFVRHDLDRGHLYQITPAGVAALRSSAAAGAQRA